jgi:hypothetical protein
MDDVLLGQLIDHTRNLLQQSLGFVFLGRIHQFLDLGTGGFVLVAVAYTLGFVCPDAFFG